MGINSGDGDALAAEHAYYSVVLPLGLLFGLAGWLRARNGSILPGIAIHILTDTPVFVLAMIATARGTAA
jgi:hypothetical protein